MTSNDLDTFEAAFNAVALKVHDIAVSSGWWDHPRPESEQLLLIHCEVSEAVESLRFPEMPQSEHIPQFTALEEELADIVIRAMDVAHGRHRLAEAIVAKMMYNQSRPYRHGGKKF